MVSKGQSKKAYVKLMYTFSVHFVKSNNKITIASQDCYP